MDNEKSLESLTPSSQPQEKARIAVAPSSTDLPASLDTVTYEEAKDILSGPKRRGAKVGTGVGRIRKAPEQYSTNENTLRSRKRFAESSEIVKDIERAKTSERVWVSREIAKWKETDAFKSIPAEEVDKKLAEKRKALLVERKANFGDKSQQIVIGIVDKFRDHLLSEAQIEEENAIQQLQNELEQVKDELQRAKDDKVNESVDEEADIQDDDANLKKLTDYCKADKSIRKLEKALGEEEKATYESALIRKAARKAVGTLDLVAWKHYRKAIQRSHDSFQKKAQYLQELTPEKWQTLVDEDTAEPHKFFTSKEVQIWRSLWGCTDQQTVDLPGPEEWWPNSARDDPTIYEARITYMKKYGWAAGEDVGTAAYKKFWELIQEALPPDNWDTYMLNTKNDLYWSEGTINDPKITGRVLSSNTGVADLDEDSEEDFEEDSESEVLRIEDIEDDEEDLETSEEDISEDSEEDDLEEDSEDGGENLEADDMEIDTE